MELLRHRLLRQRADLGEQLSLQVAASTLALRNRVTTRPPSKIMPRTPARRRGDGGAHVVAASGRYSWIGSSLR